jgi:hypothetical protein
MPLLQTSNYTITSGSAVLICDGDPSGIHVQLHNTDNTTPIYLGGSTGVTSTTGYRMDGKDKVNFILSAMQPLWAICASGSATISVLRQPQ